MPKSAKASSSRAKESKSMKTNSAGRHAATRNSRRRSSTLLPSCEQVRKLDEAMKNDFDAELLRQSESASQQNLNARPHKKTRRRTISRTGTILEQPVTVHQPSPMSPLSGKSSVAGTRRMSALYGHGHLLDGQSTPTQLPTPEPTPLKSAFGKRKFSATTLESPTSKRVRFSQSPEARTFSTPPPFSNEASASEEEEGFSLQQKSLPENRYVELLAHLSEMPTKLSLADVSGCFNTLQDIAEEFATRWFGQVDSNDSVEFPIHELQEHYPAIYYTMQYILDASTTNGVTNDGWHRFLTKPEYRQYLVYAILGEWFNQRIFRHTSFGLKPDMQEFILEKVDRAYLHHDAIVRGKIRSEEVKAYWEDDETAQDYLDLAADNFTDELLTVLAPLMSSFKSAEEKKLKLNLKQLVKYCAGLHLSLIRTGENGTVFFFGSRIENGREFPRGALSVCVNDQMCNSMRAESDPNEKLLIKMTCWARVEAYVFHGKDQVEMARKEKELIGNTIRETEQGLGRALMPMEISKLANDFDWVNHPEGREFWGPLPRELWTDTRERREKEDMKARSYAFRNQDSHAKKRQEARSARGNDGGDDDPVSSDSDGDFQPFSPASSDRDEDVTDQSASTDAEQRDETLRGPYLTIYHSICPHKVYCEWTKTQSKYDEELVKLHGESVKGKPLRRVNSLAAAVADARSQLKGQALYDAKSEDVMRKVWNYYAEHNRTIEWTALGVSAAALVLYKIGCPQALGRAALNGFGSAAFIKNVWEKLERLMNKNGHSMGIQSAWNPLSWKSNTKAFQQALRNLGNIREAMGIHKSANSDITNVDVTDIPEALLSGASSALAGMAAIPALLVPITPNADTTIDAALPIPTDNSIVTTESDLAVPNTSQIDHLLERLTGHEDLPSANNPVEVQLESQPSTVLESTTEQPQAEVLTHEQEVSQPSNINDDGFLNEQQEDLALPTKQDVPTNDLEIKDSLESYLSNFKSDKPTEFTITKKDGKKIVALTAEDQGAFEAAQDEDELLEGMNVEPLITGNYAMYLLRRIDWRQ